MGTHASSTDGISMQGCWRVRVVLARMQVGLREAAAKAAAAELAGPERQLGTHKVKAAELQARRHPPASSDFSSNTVSQCGAADRCVAWPREGELRASQCKRVI